MTTDINPHAWAHAVRTEYEGIPLWAFIADDDKLVARIHAILTAYLSYPSPAPAESGAVGRVMAAKALADWLGYSWDGLPDRGSDGFPDWAYDGTGRKRYQGGKEGLLRLVAALDSPPDHGGGEGEARDTDAWKPADAVKWNGRGFTLEGGPPKWLRAAVQSLGTPDKVVGSALRMGDQVHIGTRLGVKVASAGDWIILYANGELGVLTDFEYSISGIEASLPNQESEDGR